MSTTSEFTFDKVALDYDRLWSSTPIGTHQRSAFWQTVDPLFAAGDCVLDLGCGTGVDALHLAAAGIQVYGIDASPQMIGITLSRGVNAHLLPIENVGNLRRQFDGAISNFGALNCVSNLDGTASALAKLIRRGGHVALCFLSRVCAWEIGYYLLHGNPQKALRRLNGQSSSPLAKDVFYLSSASIVSTFEPYFRLRQRVGIGLCVPPSYVGALSERLIRGLSALDRRLAHRPILRSLSDHSLYVFERL